MRPTIGDVARAAGVSPTTVSHAFTGRRPVSEGAREAVLRAAQDLGYRRPAAAARAAPRTRIVGLVVPDLTNPFYPALVAGVQEALGEDGYQAVVYGTGGSPSRELAAVRDLLDRAVDGMVIDLFGSLPDDLGELIAETVPVLLLGATDAGPIGDRVDGDDRVSVAQATRHLIDRGHRAIAFVGAPLGRGPGDARRAGYEDALLAAGVPLQSALVAEADYTRAGAQAAVGALLDRGVAFDALVCANDLSAIGAIDALLAAGIKVPADVAVVGFDDIEASSLIRPTLTTVDNRAHDKGLICGRLLRQRITGELSGPYRHITVPGTFIERESS